MHADIKAYHQTLTPSDRKICNVLAREIDTALPDAESKIWHRHPVWFLDGNPIVGYSKLKDCIRLLFWSGQSFQEPGLTNEGSFKAAEARFTDADQIDPDALKRWLEKSRDIQWDYKNIVRRKGQLLRLKSSPKRFASERLAKARESATPEDSCNFVGKPANRRGKSGQAKSWQLD